MSDFNPINPSATTPFPPPTPSNVGDIYNAWDPSSFARSYNLKLITYDTSSNATRIDFYKNASSFSNTGSLVYSQEYQYSGSNVIAALTILP